MRSKFEPYDHYLDDILTAFMSLSPRAKEVMKLCTDEVVIGYSVHLSESKNRGKPIPMIEVGGGLYYNQFKETVARHYRDLKRKYTARELCKYEIARYKNEIKTELIKVSRDLESMYGKYGVEVHNVENQIHNHPDIENTKRVLKNTLDEYVNRYLNEFFREENNLGSVDPAYRYDVRLQAVMKSFNEQVELTKQSRESVQQQTVQEDEFSKEQKEFESLRANLDDLMRQ